MLFNVILFFSISSHSVFVFNLYRLWRSFISFPYIASISPSISSLSFSLSLYIYNIYLISSYLYLCPSITFPSTLFSFILLSSTLSFLIFTSLLSSSLQTDVVEARRKLLRWWVTIHLQSLPDLQQELQHNPDRCDMIWCNII